MTRCEARFRDQFGGEDRLVQCVHEAGHTNVTHSKEWHDSGDGDLLGVIWRDQDSYLPQPVVKGRTSSPAALAIKGAQVTGH